MLRRFQLKGKAGYVSIEAVVVAGLMLALGAYAISQLYETAGSVMWEILSQVSSLFLPGGSEGPPLGGLVLE
ncbi:hypothetical protein [Geobacillus subterraneus]|uniref:Uncharacterized protein n=1 Tax=Geobacillus subterraneus TaxID=129338 RepID=A0A679FS38_9BACL|nr:hypothetical protein [Geobacillus subterraneus]BBW98950.1 hypothetical protein GsuE55_37830 [Geobacillus subterraneus]